MNAITKFKRAHAYDYLILAGDGTVYDNEQQFVVKYSRERDARRALKAAGYSSHLGYIWNIHGGQKVEHNTASQETAQTGEDGVCPSGSPATSEVQESR